MWGWAALTLAIGALGGGLLNLTGIPLAWLLGSALGTSAAAFGRLPVVMPRPTFIVVLALLGVLIGSTFRPDIFADVARWPFVVGIVALYLGVTTSLGFVYFRKIGGYGRATAFFASIPGGFGEMTATCESEGGDVRVVAIAHSIRLAGIVTIIPLFLRIVEGFSGGPPVSPTPLTGLALPDVLLLIACAVAGYPLAKIVRFPAPALFGPLFLSAGAHFAGIGQIQAPDMLIYLAQIGLGASVGVRFAGSTFSAVRRMIYVSTGWIVIAVALALTLGAVISPILDIPRPTTILALTPGGLPEMSMMSLALGVDAAFVTTMQFIRYLLIVTAAPVLYRLFRKRVRD